MFLIKNKEFLRTRSSVHQCASSKATTTLATLFSGGIDGFYTEASPDNVDVINTSDAGYWASIRIGREVSTTTVKEITKSVIQLDIPTDWKTPKKD